MSCWIKIAPASVVLRIFCLLGELRQQGPATEIHLCVSSCELRVASPAHARAFVQPVALKFISAPARMGHGLKRARMDFVLWPQAELRLQGLDKTTVLC